MSKRCMFPMSPSGVGLKKQQGSAIVVAVFVIVIISLLAAALASLQRDSARGTSYEVYAARAYFSAYTAGEIALATLFPLGETEADQTACLDVETAVDLGTDVGFHGCTASYQCSIILPSDAESLPTRYKIVSEADCENTETITHRKITVEAVGL